MNYFALIIGKQETKWDVSVEITFYYQIRAVNLPFKYLEVGVVVYVKRPNSSVFLFGLFFYTYIGFIFPFWQQVSLGWLHNGGCLNNILYSILNMLYLSLLCIGIYTGRTILEHFRLHYIVFFSYYVLHLKLIFIFFIFCYVQLAAVVNFCFILSSI